MSLLRNLNHTNRSLSSCVLKASSSFAFGRYVSYIMLTVGCCVLAYLYSSLFIVYINPSTSSCHSSVHLMSLLLAGYCA